MTEETKLYELLYLIPGSLSEQEIDPIAEHIRLLITSQQGVLVREDKPMRRKLAYPIKQYSHGFYTLIYFNANPSAINELNATLIHTTSILRHVLMQPSRMTDLAPQYSLTDKRTEKQVTTETPRAPVAHDEQPTLAQDTTQEPIPVPSREDIHDTETKEPEQEPPQKSTDSPDASEEPEQKPKTPKRDKKSKISLDDLDEKLDEILTSDTL